MPLNKAGLQAAFVAALSQNSPTTIDTVAASLADAIDAYVKTALVTIPGAGLIAPPGGGPVTGTSITGTLS